MDIVKWGKRKKLDWNQIRAEETRAGTPIGFRRRAHPGLIGLLFILTATYCLFVALHKVGLDLVVLIPLIGAWSTIAASETDADSPLNQTLFDKIRNNLDYLYATGAQIINETGSESQDDDMVNNYVINDSIDFRNRNISIRGIVVASTANNSATALADAQKILPGGAEDDEVFYADAGNGTNGSPNLTSVPEYDWVDAFMYSGAGGAAYNTKPYIKYAGQLDATYVDDFYIWVDSGNDGRLMLSTKGSAVSGFYRAAAWNLQITYSEDLS